MEHTKQQGLLDCFPSLRPLMMLPERGPLQSLTAWPGLRPALSTGTVACSAGCRGWRSLCSELGAGGGGQPWFRDQTPVLLAGPSSIFLNSFSPNCWYGWSHVQAL